jgi:hypothetical protein
MSFNFSPKIVTDGLVLYLDAANTKSYVSGSTRWNDISRGGNNGTLVNGPTFSGSNGGSIVFDGIDDYVKISNSGYDLGVNFTLQFWTKIAKFGGHSGSAWNRSALITNSYPYTPGQGFWVAATSQLSGAPYSPTPGRETFFISMGLDQYEAAASAGSLTAYVNKWVNLSVTVNGTNPIRLYINGVEVSYAVQENGPSTWSYTPSSPFALGVRNISEEYLQGSISIAKIYNRRLSAQEILQNYNATKSRFI